MKMSIVDKTRKIMIPTLRNNAKGEMTSVSVRTETVALIALGSLPVVLDAAKLVLRLKSRAAVVMDASCVVAGLVVAVEACVIDTAVNLLALV
jgi:hypothetical protein